MNLRIPYYGPPSIVFYDSLDALSDEMLASIRDVQFIPYSASRAPTWIAPAEPDYPVLVSDPGPLDAGD